MDSANIFKDTIQPIVISVGSVVALFVFIFGLIQYKNQQRFKRLQNLSALWNRFSNDDDLISLFSLMDEVENGDASKIEEVKSYGRKTKLKYLALIEEVSLYVDAFEVDASNAQYLFQWHFYFPYQSEYTANAFWSNLGGQEEQKANYWKKSRDLAIAFKP